MAKLTNAEIIEALKEKEQAITAKFERMSYSNPDFDYYEGLADCVGHCKAFVQKIIEEEN